MPNDNSNELDASLVSISRQTDDSEIVHRKTLQALSLLPVNFKKELADLGVRIILTPTILEALPNLDVELTEVFGTDKEQYEEWAKSWPCLYEPPTKTIYIGEKWVGCKGNKITYNVLNMCAFAYQKSADLDKSKDLYKAIIDDLDCVPADLLPSNVSDQGQFFASIWAAVIICDSGDDDGRWAIGMTGMFPRTTAFVNQALASFQ